MSASKSTVANIGKSPAAAAKSPKAQIPLPPIEDCLFGISQQCPRIYQKGDGRDERESLEENHQDPDDYPEEEDELNVPDIPETYDSFQTGRWGEAANQHDINLPQLRKVCSQGIADEGSYRGIAWRVLLNYLNTKDIAKSWAEEVPPQRELYQQLVEQYFDGEMDQGRDLRGQLSKTLRNRRLRKKYNILQRLDESVDDIDADDIEDNDDEDASVFSDMQTPTKPSGASDSSPPPRRFSKIQEVLPPRFKEQWKRSGINLEKTVMTNGSNADPSTLNSLKVPELDETKQELFQVFMEDAKLLEEIRKDVHRTHPDLYFFLEPTEDLGVRRYGALERILFVWAKLNRGVRYVQGMNEIVGTIYYVLANDHNSEWANHAEADTYYLFHTVMIEMKDVFVPDMDSHSTGIQGRIENMQRLLKTHDPEVHEHLQECGIDASFFAIRWLTTLLSREFLLPDTIRMWDSMFASTHKENFLRYVCGTMVMMIRDDLLKGDFAACLRLLQSYPPANVDMILESSRSLWIYESQITLACHRGGISLHQALQAITPPPSIIMAFGLRDGVAPNLHDRIENAKQNAQEKVQTATEGLLGRAHRLWSGWGGSTMSSEVDEVPKSASNEEKANQSDESSTQTPATPVKSRFWNRARSNTSDSQGSNPPTPSGSTTRPAGKGGTFALTPAPDNNTVGGRRTIWNRSPAQTPKAEEGLETPAVDLPNLKPAGDSPPRSTTPLRRQIWNRGPPPQSNDRNEGSSKDSAVPVN